MPYELVYHPAVRSDDLPLINSDVRARIRIAIETRLSTAPHEYGEPLRKTLRGYWKLRVGDYRVVYIFEESKVFILGIRHRKNVYEMMEKRITENR